MTLDELCLAHEASHARAILAGESENGFGNRSPSVAASPPWTSGAVLSAARDALRTGGVACAPASGFHHAGWAYCRGFCTFNGLMVAVRALLREGAVARVGILDYDAHYGDGTDDIIARTGCAAQVRHITAGAEFGSRADAPAFLAAIPGHIEALRGCDLVIYQAGADPHVNDPLGGMLTSDELARRDRLVFEAMRAAGVPLAWNLAGGYQRDRAGTIRPVLEVHDATARTCEEVYGGR